MEKTKEILIKYIPAIEKIFGKNLVSIILFGSAVKGDFVKGKSDVNLLVVRKKQFAEELISLNKLYTKLKLKINLAVPLVLTENEIKRSTDVFPMEYRDIKEFHIVLKGRDIFKNLKIEDKYLRLELESQIKGKLILLRESLVQSFKNKKILKNVLLNSIPSINVILRNVFILNKKDAPQNILELVNSAEKITKIKFNSFKEIIRLKQGLKKISPSEITDIYLTYISEIEKLSNYIDKFKIRKRK